MVTTRERLKEFGDIPRGKYTEVAEKLGVSRERVSQLLGKRKGAICPHCGGYKDFQSKQCRACWSLRPRIRVVCANCGEFFSMTPYRASRTKRHFCSNCWGTLSKPYQPRQGHCPSCKYTAPIRDFRLGRDGGKPNG